jgi:hypothetical protein
MQSEDNVKIIFSYFMILRKLVLFLRHFMKRLQQGYRVYKSTFAKATADKSGCSAARLAHLVWDQRVAGSNPATPTKEKALSASAERALFIMSVANLFA